MSSKVTIEPTAFTNVRTGCRSLGIRVYDDYGQAYDNTWDLIPDDDMDVLKKTMNSDDEVIVTMLDFVFEHEEGINIGGEHYSWEEIRHLWNVEEEG